MAGVTRSSLASTMFSAILRSATWVRASSQSYSRKARMRRLSGSRGSGLRAGVALTRRAIVFLSTSTLMFGLFICGRTLSILRIALGRDAIAHGLVDFSKNLGLFLERLVEMEREPGDIAEGKFVGDFAGDAAAGR